MHWFRLALCIICRSPLVYPPLGATSRPSARECFETCPRSSTLLTGYWHLLEWGGRLYQRPLDRQRAALQLFCENRMHRLANLRHHSEISLTCRVFICKRPLMPISTCGQIQAIELVARLSSPWSTNSMSPPGHHHRLLLSYSRIFIE